MLYHCTPLYLHVVEKSYQAYSVPIAESESSYKPQQQAALGYSNYG